MVHCTWKLRRSGAWSTLPRGGAAAARTPAQRTSGTHTTSTCKGNGGANGRTGLIEHLRKLAQPVPCEPVAISLGVLHDRRWAAEAQAKEEYPEPYSLRYPQPHAGTVCFQTYPFRPP
jgi:hypothetical protein